MYFQIRYHFGCYDEIHEIDEEDVRHCNWVRFLQASDSIDEVNIVGVKLNDQVIFQVVKDILPNTELKAFFDIGHQMEPPESAAEPVITTTTKDESPEPNSKSII